MGCSVVVGVVGELVVAVEGPASVWCCIVGCVRFEFSLTVGQEGVWNRSLDYYDPPSETSTW